MKMVTKPLKYVDEILLEKLAKLHLSDRVICGVLAISEDTLQRRYADKIDVWKSESKLKIAEVLYDEAVNRRSAWALKLYAQRFLGFDQNTIKIEPRPKGREGDIPVQMTKEEKLEMLELYRHMVETECDE